MKSIINNGVITQLRKVHQAAFELKEKYDRKEDKSIISAYAKMYLTEYDHLLNSLPDEIRDPGIDECNNWIRRKLSDTYNDVRSICVTHIYRLEDAYIKFVVKQYYDSIQSFFKE